MMKKLFIIFLSTVVFPSCVLAKGYKGYVSHYWTAFAIEKTEFGEFKFVPLLENKN